LQKHFRRERPDKIIVEILLQHDNARPHTSLKTQAGITKLGWTVLPNLLYIPDLITSDCHHFGALKDAIRGKRIGTCDEVN
jgi:hypothetical protein